jgi:hypothetical protein
MRRALSADQDGSAGNRGSFAESKKMHCAAEWKEKKNTRPTGAVRRVMRRAQWKEKQKAEQDHGP